MKYSFLRTNLALAIIGLLLGLVGGFKLANWQYRRQAGVTLQNSVAQAAGRLQQAGGNRENMTPQQREQLFNEIKAIIDKAKASPNDVEAQLDAADRFIQVSQPDEALQFLEQAQKANPNDSRTMHGFALVYSMKTQFEEAIKAAKRSLELSPDNSRVQMLLFTIYLESKTHLDEAEKIIASLETSGDLSPQIISRAREDLNKVRTGVGGGTVLDHGPKDPK
ncbi:MAG: tetratricopeptide repeat protein [Acidobacteria bacterium]|nr:tetratricopeptide repeat protein [Acidobacteriota bacterium]